MSASQAEAIPCNDANETVSTSATGGTVLADSRARRRELQEQRTLQALELIGMKPGMPATLAAAAAAAVATNDNLVTPPVPMRERKRPPPLLHLDADSDNEDVPEVPQIKPNAVKKPVEADKAAMSRKWSWVCLALVIAIACLCCMAFLVWTGNFSPSTASLVEGHA